MTSPTRQLPGLDQRAILNDMFSDTSYQKYAINDAKLESSGDVARKGLKHWSGISADRRRFVSFPCVSLLIIKLTERHGAECRQRFPYETFRNDMVAFVIAVLGTSRMLDMVSSLSPSADGSLHTDLPQLSTVKIQVRSRRTSSIRKQWPLVWSQTLMMRTISRIPDNPPIRQSLPKKSKNDKKKLPVLMTMSTSTFCERLP